MTEHTYIFHNTSERVLHLVVEPFGHELHIKPGEMFSFQNEGIPPVLQKLYGRGDLDYWLIDTSPIRINWQKEGF